MLLFLICLSFGPLITNEGNNYLPTNHVNAKSIKSIKSGWHFIKIIDNSILSKYPEIFTLQSLASSNWFVSYLSIEQLQQLASSNKTILFPIHQSYKENVKINGLNKFFVRASSSFIKQINDTFFTEIKAMPNGLYFLATSNLNKRKAINLFIDSPDVLSFSELPKIKPLNRWAKGFVQNGDNSFGYNGQTYTGNNSLNQLGYVGAGQIVTIEDSGVDFTLRYFKDNSISVPINSINRNHRKIVKYKTIKTSDSSDFSGHGTHCAGSIAGENIESSDYFSAYDGGAPKAKLYVVDLEDGNGQMYANPDFADTLKDMIDLGSFISSNSWGVENDDGQIKYLYDLATYHNSNILWVFAAGNSYGVGTVMSPGSCKNVLTVGALDAIYNRNAEVSSNVVFDIITNDKFKIINPNTFFVSSPFDALMTQSEAIDAYNKTAVLYSSNQSSYVDSAVYLSDCDQALDAAKRGATLILAPTSLSCSGIEKSIGVVIQNSVNFNRDLLGKQISLFPRLNTPSQRTLNVASFSSRGPSIYGSIKPEVVAPGTDISSASRGRNNEVITMSGTSMATPTTAGEMVILREYIIKKFGIEKPTSNLLKAFVICGATKSDNPSLPNNEIGFGILNVGNVVEEISGNKVLIQNEISINFGATLSFDLVVDNINRPLSIAMSYIDFPLNPQAVLPLAVDLDLFVVTPDKKLLHPLGESEDQYSTVERIYVESSKVTAGTYHVYVKSSQPISSISAKSITLSLVAIGNISSFTPTASSSRLLANTTNSPWTDVCSNKSVAVEDGCNCYNDYTGLFCQHGVISIQTNIENVYKIPPMETLYLKGSLVGMNENCNLNLWQQTSKPCFIKIHANSVNLPKNIMNYMITGTFNKSKKSFTGDPSLGFQSNQPIYYAITNFGSFEAILSTSFTIDQPPLYSDEDDMNLPVKERGISFSTIVSIIFVIIFFIVIVICIVFCCKKKKQRPRTQRNRASASTSNRQNTNNNNNNNNNNVNGGAANMTVPAEVDPAYVPPSYPSGYTNTYPYPYPASGYPQQNQNVLPPASPSAVYQPSQTGNSVENVPVVEPKPVPDDANKINNTNSNQGVPPINPYDPANFPSVNANRPSYYPPYANPDDDK